MYLGWTSHAEAWLNPLPHYFTIHSIGREIRFTISNIVDILHKRLELLIIVSIKNSGINNMYGDMAIRLYFTFAFFSSSFHLFPDVFLLLNSVLTHALMKILPHMLLIK